MVLLKFIACRAFIYFFAFHLWPRQICTHMLSMHFYLSSSSMNYNFFSFVRHRGMNKCINSYPENMKYGALKCPLSCDISKCASAIMTRNTQRGQGNARHLTFFEENKTFESQIRNACTVQ